MLNANTYAKALYILYLIKRRKKNKYFIVYLLKIRNEMNTKWFKQYKITQHIVNWVCCECPFLTKIHIIKGTYNPDKRIHIYAHNNLQKDPIDTNRSSITHSLRMP